MRNDYTDSSDSSKEKQKSKTTTKLQLSDRFPLTAKSRNLVFYVVYTIRTHIVSIQEISKREFNRSSCYWTIFTQLHEISFQRAIFITFMALIHLKSSSVRMFNFSNHPFGRVCSWMENSSLHLHIKSHPIHIDKCMHACMAYVCNHVPWYEMVHWKWNAMNWIRSHQTQFQKANHKRSCVFVLNFLKWDFSIAFQTNATIKMVDHFGESEKETERQRERVDEVHISSSFNWNSHL